jgi:hypothetical protein
MTTACLDLFLDDIRTVKPDVKVELRWPVRVGPSWRHPGGRSLGHKLSATGCAADHNRVVAVGDTKGKASHSEARQ